VKAETGDIIIPLQAKLFEESHLKELGNLVSGKEKGRANPQEITVFKTVGIAVQDAVIANEVIAFATSKGLGLKTKL
jgi:ornithine cyclodeaminase/alanine dehydrogenase